MLTLGEAKKLTYRDVLVDNYGKRWYVNGQVKTWKRDVSRVRIPLKHGLYTYGALNGWDFQPNGVCEWMSLEK